MVSLGGKGWTNMTSLTPPLDVELAVHGYENEMPCMCGRSIDFVSVSTTFLLYFGTLLTLQYFLFFYSIIVSHDIH
jgi:hypothetical protein